MGKNKLKKFAECKKFACMLEPEKSDFLDVSYKYKGLWSRDFFKNDNPIFLELGCGTGAYSMALSKMYKDRNFVALDIKGARMWSGAKQANEEQLCNIAFLRTNIEFINRFFSENEVSGIWITFPDPHLRNSERCLRLTSPLFLEKYSFILKKSGFMHLKTDSKDFFNYTLSVLKSNSIVPEFLSDDLYACGDELEYEVKGVQTVYENRFLAEGKPICYMKFALVTKVLTNIHSPETRL